MYKSAALSNFFLMNNVHYMVFTVEVSEALWLLGPDWVERHKDIIESYCAGERQHSTGNGDTFSTLPSYACEHRSL